MFPSVPPPKQLVGRSIDCKLKPGWRYDEERAVFVGPKGQVLAPVSLPKGARIVYKVPSLAHSSGRSLSPAERDLSRYLQHVLLHRVPLLWRLHRIHHSDVGYDCTTALRFHPLEALLTIGAQLGIVVALGAPPEPPARAVVAQNGRAARQEEVVRQLGRIAHARLVAAQLELDGGPKP